MLGCAMITKEIGYILFLAGAHKTWVSFGLKKKGKPPISFKVYGSRRLRVNWCDFLGSSNK
jgi:hypothetical protein